MFDFIYSGLNKIGYTHPLHPIITHLTIGLVIGSFVFLLLGYVTRQESFFTTARHAVGLALATVPVTIFLGYTDWQHFYRGAWLFTFQMKFFFAGLLAVFLIVSLVLAFINRQGSGIQIIAQVICLLAVTGLGYFGGNLVYGTGDTPKTVSDNVQEESAPSGQMIFADNCAACHYTDRTDEKAGPGLKGLFQMKTLPVSGWPVNEDTVRKQLLTPYRDMPDSTDLSENEIAAVITYLKSL